MTTTRKYAHIPGVTYPPDGAPEWDCGDTKPARKPSPRPADIRAKRAKRIKRRKLDTKAMPLNGFGSVRAFATSSPSHEQG